MSEREEPGAAAHEPVRLRIRVEGIVQGVGYRPFVQTLATRMGLDGLVGNNTGGVFVEAQGEPAAVAAFLAALGSEAPPLALVERVHTQPMPPSAAAGFRIVASPGGGQRRTLIAPDVAPCADCLAELHDRGARRHGYAFVNCTNCGPRFTIVRDVPYDRPFTTMAPFTMCPDCAHEYGDPGDRRFHAQPLCCPACGPRLSLVGADGTAMPGDPLAGTAALLARGLVVAVKGLGGYHLAVDAGDGAAVARLRKRKHREERPFAVMVADLDGARQLCTVSAAESALLTDARRPIVLLRRRPGAPVADPVAPGNAFLGLLLPYTPLHHLLVAARPRPFVLTSGNVSDEPMAHDDDDAQQRLGGIADAFLRHDRAIHMRADDSVVRVVAERPLMLRRARGYAPRPVSLPVPASRGVLAVGAELKSTFCLASGRRAFVSHHIGDLENYETLRSFVEGIAHYARLFDIAPAVIAHDLHPEYLSTKHALERDAVAHIGVQHHHAHVASCLADNGLRAQVIGVAFDGLGYGSDGTLWGGELLVADLLGAQRVGHLLAVPMPGGAAAIRQPWRMAAAWLDVAYGEALPEELEVRMRNAARWDAVVALGRRGLNAPLTSSVGRLFDALAAIAGVRDVITYEGQAAVELEQRADEGERGRYPLAVVEAGPVAPLVLDARPTLRAVVEDLRAGAGVGRVSARFHNGLAAAVVRSAVIVRERTGLSTVALSGGVYQNALLLRRTLGGLQDAGFAVLTHRQVPPNDGGISLGQAAVAAARTAAGSDG